MQGFEPVQCFSAIQQCQKHPRLHPSSATASRPTTSVRGLTRGKERPETWLETENLGPDRIGTIGGYIAWAGR